MSCATSKPFWTIPPRAGRWASAHASTRLQRFAPATYATALLQALEAATQAQPAVWTARAVGRRLAEIGMKPDDPAVVRMDDLLARMLC